MTKDRAEREILVGTVEKFGSNGSAELVVRVEKLKSKGNVVDIRLLTKKPNNLQRKLTKYGVVMPIENYEEILEILNSSDIKDTIKEIKGE